MDRRAFLTLRVPAAAVPPAPRIAAPAKPTARFALGYRDGGLEPRWVEALQRSAPAVAGQVRITMRAVRPARIDRLHPVHQFNLELVHAGATPDTTAAIPWGGLKRHAAVAPEPGIALNFDAGYITALRVSYEYVDRSGKARSYDEQLCWTDEVRPALAPGYYLLAGPCAGSGRPPAWNTLDTLDFHRSETTNRDDTADFDAVLIAVEAADLK